MQAVLVMFRSDGERRSFSISRDTTVIGRRQDCDLMIPLGEISRKHCRIIRDGDELRLEDLGSSNGTLHNGRRVQEIVLSAGDTIQVGPVSFVLQIDGEPAEEEMTPHTGEPRAAAAAHGDEDDALEALPDDLDEATPSTELDTLEEDAPAEVEAAHEDDGALEVLGDEDEEASAAGGGGHDLDSEIEIIGIDDDKLEMLDDSASGDIALDDDKPKARHK